MRTIYVQNISPHHILKDMNPQEAFLGKKPSVEHLRIFGYPVYIHVPKDKRKKLEPLGRKGIFVGYNESSKAYIIYIPEHYNIQVSRDVTFNENIAFKKSIEDSMEEEYEEPKEESTCSPESQNKEPEQPDQPVQPCGPIESIDVPKNRKHPTWLEATLQEAKRLKAPSGTFKESKNPKRFSSYVACMRKLINEEPTTFEEAVQKK
jgi:hypothetical protein